MNEKSGKVTKIIDLIDYYHIRLDTGEILKAFKDIFGKGLFKPLLPEVGMSVVFLVDSEDWIIKVLKSHY